MFSNYLRIAFRNLKSRPLITSINGLGLATGLACCILISLYVIHEQSFDRMHEKSDRIYRLNKYVTLEDGGRELHAITGGQMGPTIASVYPEVEQSLRVLPWFDDILFERDELAVKVSDVLIADSNFFSVFDFTLLRGRPDRVLTDPGTLVLSEETAARMFGNEDPIGQVVTGLNGLPYTVTGIVEDAPGNSHLQYNALISWATTGQGENTLNFGWLNNWLTQVTYTYVVLTPGADPRGLEARFKELMQEYLPQRAGEYELYLQPLADMYLGSANILYTRSVQLGNSAYVRWFTILGIIILMIACINYMNLATARYTRRNKEIGVRKVLGAEKMQLSRQFLVESLMLTVGALGVALLVVKAFLPLFNTITSRSLTFSPLENPGLMAGIVVLALFAGLFAGSYPAVFLSGIQPIQALRKVQARANKGVSMRRVLVVGQFAASMVLIICTAVVVRQMSYMQSQDPGFERDHIIVLPIGVTDIQDQFEPFKQAVLQHPNITHAAGSNSVPGTREAMSSYQVVPEGQSETTNITAYTWRLDDDDLLETYGMEMAKGRYFSDDFTTDASSGVVINETLARRLGWEDPVGKRLDINGETEGARVIGVLKDFHFESFHHPIESLILYMAPRYENVSVRIEGGNLAEVMGFLRTQWEAFDPVYPFEYAFLDETAAQQYEMENQLLKTLIMFSGLAIFIACMGLFGLAAFSTQQRTREIGIRKAVGATVGSLVQLVSKEFVQLVAVAFVISVPIGYIVMAGWLEGFAFRAGLSWWIFAGAGLLSLMISVLTVSYHSIRLALSNPVKALRYE